MSRITPTGGGGIGWEEVATFDAVSTNLSVSVPGSEYDELAVKPSGEVKGFDEMRINGITASEYSYIDNSDSGTFGTDRIQLGLPSNRIQQITLSYSDYAGQVAVNVEPASGGNGQATVAASCGSAASIPIESLQFLINNQAAMRGKIYGRNL